MSFIAKMQFFGATKITCMVTVEALTRNSRCFSGRRFAALWAYALCFACLGLRDGARYDAAVFDLVEIWKLPQARGKLLGWLGPKGRSGMGRCAG